MTEKTLNNNQVVVAGEIASEFTFSHEIFGEGFYMVDLMVSRLSDAYDVIPLMVSDRLFDVNESHVGEKIMAKGQFRSYNKHEETKNRLILSVFVREIEQLDEDEPEEENRPNQIYLDGYICKAPVYRMTPLGREIADVLLAVNRAYGKSRTSVITYLAYAGEEMRDLQENFRSGNMWRYGEGYRAENIRNVSTTTRWLAE